MCDVLLGKYGYDLANMSTNPKPTIYRNLDGNTGAGSNDPDLLHISKLCQHYLVSCQNKVITPPLLLNPLTAKSFNLNFHPLEVVSR